uniref:Vacuolar-sorting protein SNF8 n=1 Tax=Oncorhynchus mykiss TaxID=8022 RepID=A0A8C7SDI1_ONCMY
MHRRGVGGELSPKSSLQSHGIEVIFITSKKYKHLSQFASKHKQEIHKSSQFRVQFQFCSRFSVSLTAGKGFCWQSQRLLEMLGVGDFYYELGVQIIEVCLALKHINGDEASLEHTQGTERVHHQGRGKSAQNVKMTWWRAIKKLKAMENGFGVIPVGSSYLVQSVPAELNMDHTVVLQLAEKKGYISVSEIRESLKWERERVCHVLEHLLKEGLAWLDSQASGEPQYWLPALFSELTSLDVTPEEANQMTP